MQQGQIRVVVHFAIHAQGNDEFRRMARDATAFVQANEPDAVTYEWFVAEDGTTAVLHEVWASPEALVAHLQGPVGAEMLPNVFAVADMTDADFFGPATPELRATAEGLPFTEYGAAFTALER